ncbi:fluoride efflux transporter FluC [Actinomyces urogenitalis]|uniref:fluoride efflux transporter FluC n=1 Tax=Actinomyces urogenitalis TaxID=103621 RepID=UPI00242D803C|nr:CrcB family protein [Actinomyces urogenitalis]MCI7457346.1 CrcB family protein [Actinomyces urogenitalis]
MTAATWLLLALAGGLGAVTRFKVDSRVGTVLAARRQRRRTADASSAAVTGAGRRLPVAVPLGTVVVNVSACLLLGLLTGASGALAPTLVTILGTGFLGGYSTFSTACVEAARLMLSGRPWAGLLHAVTMAGTSLLAAVGGLALGAALAA